MLQAELEVMNIMIIIIFSEITLPTTLKVKLLAPKVTSPGGGGGVLPNMGYIGMCGPKGKGF